MELCNKESHIQRLEGRQCFTGTLSHEISELNDAFRELFNELSKPIKKFLDWILRINE